MTEAHQHVDKQSYKYLKPINSVDKERPRTQCSQIQDLILLVIVQDKQEDWKKKKGQGGRKFYTFLDIRVRSKEGGGHSVT